MVIHVETVYNALLGRPWMHKNTIIPFIYDLYVKYPLRGGRGTITTENDPFSSVVAYHVEPRFYKIKDKNMIDDDVLVTVALRHP